MTGHIILLPQKENLQTLQEIKNHVYSGGYRFRNKEKAPPPHISLSQFKTVDYPVLIDQLDKKFSYNSFSIQRSEWTLINKFQKANHRNDQDYHWIALHFGRNKHLIHLYQILGDLLDKLGINDNSSYLDNIKKIRVITDGVKYEDVDDLDCIANHMNIANYTRPEKSEECWNYIDINLAEEIRFGKLLIVMDEVGKVGEVELR